MRSVPQSTPAPFSPGVAILPEDFPERLAALKELLGFTWEGMACWLGVDPRQLQQWRNGGWPNGGAMLAIVDLATRVSGGLAVLLGCDLLVVRLDGQSREAHGGGA